jgi:hypothetical protein
LADHLEEILAIVLPVLCFRPAGFLETKMWEKEVELSLSLKYTVLTASVVISRK